MTSTAPDPLARALLPALMHGLNNATQLLASLNALAAAGDGERWLERRSADLARTSAQIEDLGYVLGVLASASGADLLGERRDARGLELVLGVVRSALRRSAAGLAPGPDPLPTLATSVGGGWELPWAVSTLLWATAVDRAPESTLAWSLEGGEAGWVLAATEPGGATLASVSGRVGDLLAGAHLDLGAEGWSLSLPGPWLRPGEEQAPALTLS
jgi:hypothetical protein